MLLRVGVGQHTHNLQQYDGCWQRNSLWSRKNRPIAVKVLSYLPEVISLVSFYWFLFSLDFSINDPSAYVIYSIYSIPVFPYFVTLNCVNCFISVNNNNVLYNRVKLLLCMCVKLLLCKVTFVYVYRVVTFVYVYFINMQKPDIYINFDLRICLILNLFNIYFIF